MSETDEGAVTMPEAEFKERLRLYEHTRAGLEQSGWSMAETYDRALLTLSSAFLGGSLALTSQVIDLQDASGKGLLYAAWAVFALTIVLTLFSFVYGLRTLEPLRKAAWRFYMRKEEGASKESVEVQSHVLSFSVAQGASFALGIVLLGVFSAVNIWENNVAQKIGSGTGKLEQRGIPPATFQTPVMLQPARPQGGTAQQPAPSPSTADGDKASGVK